MKRFGLFATILTTGLAACVFAATATLDTFAVENGQVLNGAPEDLIAADGKAIVFAPNPGRVVSVTFDGTAPADRAVGGATPSYTHGSFTIYSNTMGRALMNVDLYNYELQRWERVYINRTSPNTPRGVTIEFKEANRYICTMGQSRIKARATWNAGNYQSVAIDYVEWNFNNQP